MPLAISIIGLALSLIASIVAVTISLTQMKSNIAYLDKQQQAAIEVESKRHERIDSQDEAVAKQLTELLVLVKAFISEQTVINHTVTTALQGLVQKVESAEQRVTEAAAVNALLVEVLKRDRPSLGGS